MSPLLLASHVSDPLHSLLSISTVSGVQAYKVLVFSIIMSVFLKLSPYETVS